MPATIPVKPDPWKEYRAAIAAAETEFSAAKVPAIVTLNEELAAARARYAEATQPAFEAYVSAKERATKAYYEAAKLGDAS